MVLSVKNDSETGKPQVVYSEQLDLFEKSGKLKFNTTKTSIDSAPVDEDEQPNEFVWNEASRIMNLKYWRNESAESHLIVLTQNRVVSFPWRFCELKLDARKCNNSLYPYCVWFNGRCSDINGIAMRFHTFRI